MFNQIAHNPMKNFISVVLIMLEDVSARNQISTSRTPLGSTSLFYYFSRTKVNKNKFC